MYVADLFGGDLVTLPLGVLNALMVNIGCVLVLKFIPKLRFKSRHV